MLRTSSEDLLDLRVVELPICNIHLQKGHRSFAFSSYTPSDTIGSFNRFYI